MHIVIATKRPHELQSFITHLHKMHTGVKVTCHAEQDAVIGHIRNSPPAAVIIDEGASGTIPLELALQVIEANAFTHLALISPLPIDILHDAMEGLGVAVVLPALPDAADAATFMETMNNLNRAYQ